MTAGSLVGIAMPAGLGWDFANFYDTGRRVMAGEFHNLYDEFSSIAGQPPQGNMRFYGVPLSAYFYVPLSWFGSTTASTLFKLQGCLALAVGLWFLYLHSQQFVTTDGARQGWFAAWFAAAALIYQPFWTIYRVGGQTTPTVFLLLVAALWAHCQGRVLATAFLWTLVILIKPAFVLPAGLLAVASGLPLCLGMAVCGLAAAAVSVALVGWEVHRDFLDLMLTSAQTSVGWVYNSAATVALENLRLIDDPEPVNLRPAWLTRFVDAVRLVVGLLFLVNAWRTYHRARAEGRSSARLVIYLTALVFGLALMPIVWEHYLSVLFPPFIYVLAVHDRLPRGARTLNWLALALAAPQSLIVVQWLHDRWQVRSWPEAIAVGLVKGGPLLLTIWLWTRYNGKLCRELNLLSNAPPDAKNTTP
jgi:hypothetical protein